MVLMSEAVPESARGEVTDNASTQFACEADLQMGRIALTEALLAHFGSLSEEQSKKGAPVIATAVLLVVIMEIEFPSP